MSSTAIENTTSSFACLLLAVWGEDFILDFLEYSLPSLLAPGNLPALSNIYKTRFVFLTRSYDVPIFEESVAFQKLKDICEIQFTSINDLIIVGNYSTTLTFAYDRAIRLTGEAMLNTYFIFLTSDYIMADGSLQGLMRYMQKGYSGICAGNFQVLQEEMEQFLLDHVNSNTHVLQITPRDLLKKSFKHLHPIAITSLYENSLVHNYRANRFFLWHNQQILAGRFYLLHMLCIKPETLNYQVGSSCDYSFIPEMCPSGNIATITDSDDYLVVEIQPKEHELNFIKWGSYHFNTLINALAEWTTEQHRQNAKTTIYYHTVDLDESIKSVIEKKLDPFIGFLEQGLNKTTPQPFRQHPYWLGAVQTFQAHKSIIKESTDCDYFDLSPLNYIRKARKMFHSVFGYPPDVYPWHYRWREYSAVLKILREYVFATSPEKTIVLYDSYQLNFMRYCNWLKTKLGVPHHYHSQNLFYSKKVLTNLETISFELCIFFIRLEDLDRIRKILPIVKKILTDSGKVLILIPNQKNFSPNFLYNFPREFAMKTNFILDSPFKIASVQTVHDDFSFLGSFAIEKINAKYDHSKKHKCLVYLFIGLPASLFCLVRNCFAKIFNLKKGHCSDIFVTLVPDTKVSDPI